MTNIEIAQRFSLLADLLEIHGENPFKIKSYISAASTIERWPVPLVTISDDELYQIPGVGQAIAEKVRQLQHTGTMNALQKVKDSTPAGLQDMLKVGGLSAKKIGVIWRALEVETIEALEAAALENRIAPLKGFGAKTQKGILESVAFYKANLGYFLWAKAEAMMETLIQSLKTSFPDARFEPSGAMRRQEDVINQIELVTDAPFNSLIAWMESHPFAQILALEGTQHIRVSMPDWPIVRVYVEQAASFYWRQFITTGSDDFVDSFKKKYSISELAESEEAIFEQAGLPYLEPCLRMTSKYLEPAHAVPALIQPGDIKGLIHSHSTYSDGKATLEQMAMAAREKGLEYMVISDHSQAAQYANGLYPDRIVAQHREIDLLNQHLAPFKIFKSIEVDILGDGSLDYNDKILGSLDLVIASVHSTLKMTEAKAMSRLMKAIEHPFTTILGHMTGRLLLRRAGYPLDHKRIIDACAANKVVIEINANPRRLDMDWTWINYALEQGVVLSVNPDAHSVAGIDDIRFGVLAAQKGGLTAKDNLSSFSLMEFEAFIKQSQQKR